METTRTVEQTPPDGRAPQPKPLEIAAEDGFLLAATLYSTTERSRGMVVVHAATGAPQGYYRDFARHLSTRGLTVLTYDYRGIGGSRPKSLRGFDATMTDWARLDARAAHRAARRLADGGPLAFVGHSFGGQLVGLLDELRDETEGAVLVASQFGYYGHWPLLARARLAATWHVALPIIDGLFGYVPGPLGIGVDLPRGVAHEWARWCTDPEYLAGTHPDARERYARFDRPVALYTFTDDAIAPRGAVDAFVRALRSARIDHRRYTPHALGVDGVGHFGWFRARVGARFWSDAHAFLAAVLEGREPPAARLPAASTPAPITMRDLMADLDHGRA